MTHLSHLPSSGCAGSVSYTHLDVYKRQACGSVIKVDVIRFIFTVTMNVIKDSQDKMGNITNTSDVKLTIEITFNIFKFKFTIFLNVYKMLHV